MKKLLTVLGFFIAGSLFALDAPYHETDEFTSRTMLKMAGTGPSDLVYDLGSGDGRIVIMAAKEFGAKGVGIEIDGELVAKAVENAKDAGVSGQVRFIQEDLFQTNIASATVVTLYLLSQTNLRLRPKLLKELKPGTRVVSNNFDMGDWKPEKEERLGSHTVYMWTIPEKAAKP